MILGPPPKISENSSELQIIFKINIHVCDESCTWKKSFQTIGDI